MDTLRICRYASGLDAILVKVQKQANDNPQLEVVGQSAEDLHGVSGMADGLWHSLQPMISFILYLNAHGM